VAPRVSVVRGIGQLAHADAVEHDEEGAHRVRQPRRAAATASARRRK
jgi:hypothetical protein